jgi:Insertion element 4 transposase N-terminal
VDRSAVTRAVTAAGGRFAPGHPGELTQQVPLEMVDAVLEETCRTRRRARVLPSRVVVCLLLAGCLFAEPDAAAAGPGQLRHPHRHRPDRGLAISPPTRPAPAHRDQEPARPRLPLSTRGVAGVAVPVPGQR